MRFRIPAVLISLSILLSMTTASVIVRAQDDLTGMTCWISYDEPTEDEVFYPESILIWNPEHVSDANVSLNVTAANCSDVFRIIAEQSDLKIIYPFDNAGSVTMQVSEVPFDTAFGMLVQANNLEYFMVQASEESKPILYVGSNELLRAAFHEAGHALAATYSGDEQVIKISIFPDGEPTGETIQLPSPGGFLQTRQDLIRDIKTMLGGMIAEEIIFGDASERAMDDFDRANEIAHQIVMDYGIHNTEMEDLANPFAGEVQRIVDECYSDVELILLLHRDKLELVGARLLEVYVLDHYDLDSLLDLGPHWQWTTDWSYPPTTY